MYTKIKIFETLSDSVFLEMSAIEKIFQALNNGSKIAVACSGGGDSVFALYCIADLFEEFKDNITVFHFNHKVRESADADELFVENLCSKLNIKCVTGYPEKQLKKVSEQSLRDIRLKFFIDTARKFNIKNIVQGHNRGDVAESMLMRISRGSSLDGLCSPRVISKYKSVEFVRPLLNLSKEEIIDVLRKANVDWCEDESNSQTHFFRNRIRKDVIPQIQNASHSDFVSAAYRTRMLLAEDADLIDNIFQKAFFEANGFWENTSKMILSDDILSNKAILRRSINKIIFENNLKLRPNAIDELINRILDEDEDSFKISVGNQFLLIDKEQSTISIETPVQYQQFDISLKIGKNTLPDGSTLHIKRISLTNAKRTSIKNGENDDKSTAYIDLTAVGELNDGTLIARSKIDGDAYAPIGMNTPKKLKDMFNAKKVEIFKRKSLPVVCNKKGEILWVPYLTPSQKYKITNAGAAIEITFTEM